MVNSTTGQIAGDVQWAVRTIGVGRSLLLRHAYAGTLPSYKISRRRIFRLDELVKWMEEYRDERDDQ